VARANLAKTREEEERDRLHREAQRKAHQRELEAMEVARAQEQSQPAKPESASVDEAEQAFADQHKAILKSAFSGPRKSSSREQLPVLDIKPGQGQKPLSVPFVIRSTTGEQRHQFQTFQQNLSTRLTAVAPSQAPKSFAEKKSAQLDTYFKDYPAFVNHQAITINKKNTYIREVQPTQYPVWYERKSGWTYCNGFILGTAVQVKPDWFGFDWPTQLGTPPEGFLCQTDYVPTPWLYVTYNDQWRRAGETAYGKGPDSDYTGPISVETVEPVTGKFPDKFGVPVAQTVNVLNFYNAFYQIESARWGYFNKQGNFVWLNI
jgi:hypothetical protein